MRPHAPADRPFLRAGSTTCSSSAGSTSSRARSRRSSSRTGRSRRSTRSWSTGAGRCPARGARGARRRGDSGHVRARVERRLGDRLRLASTSRRAARVDPRQETGRRAGSGSGRARPIPSVPDRPARVARLATVDPRVGRTSSRSASSSRRGALHGGRREAEADAGAAAPAEHRGEPAGRGADRLLGRGLVAPLVGAAARHGPDRGGSNAVELLRAKYADSMRAPSSAR